MRVLRVAAEQEGVVEQVVPEVEQGALAEPMVRTAAAALVKETEQVGAQEITAAQVQTAQMHLDSYLI